MKAQKEHYDEEKGESSATDKAVAKLPAKSPERLFCRFVGPLFCHTSRLPAFGLIQTEMPKWEGPAHTRRNAS